MYNSNKYIPQMTIDLMAKSLFKETCQYGFSQTDYIRFINALLDRSIVLNASTKNKSEKNIIKSISNSQKFNFPLIGEEIYIRKLDKLNDMEKIKKWLKEDTGKYFLLSKGMPDSLNIEELILNDRNTFGIITLHDMTPIGALAYLNHDKGQYKAELRKFIGESQYKNESFIKEATKLWIQYGINNLGLKKIILNMLDINISTIKLNKDLNFMVEGVL